MPLQLVMESTNLKDLKNPVLSYTRWWVDAQIHVLKSQGTQLTLELMGEAESSDDETETKSQSGSAT